MGLVVIEFQSNAQLPKILDGVNAKLKSNPMLRFHSFFRPGESTKLWATFVEK